MELNYIKQERLRTGNTNIDKKTGFLLGIVKGDIDSLLNDRGNISCIKLDEYIESNVLNLSPDVKKEVSKNIGIIRAFHRGNILLTMKIKKDISLGEIEEFIDKNILGNKLNLITLNTILNKCDSLSEIEMIILKYGRGLEFDNITLGTILNKCKNLGELENVLNKYGEGLEFDIVTLNIILKILFIDSKTEFSKIIEYIYLILQLINNLSIIDEENEKIIIQMMSYYKDYSKPIYKCISDFRLKNLYFLLPKDKDIDEKKVYIKTPEVLKSLGKYDEALNVGFSADFAQMIGFGRLSKLIGGGGKPKNKKGHNFRKIGFFQ